MLHVSNLTKVYRIYDRPVDRLMELLTRRMRYKDFHALKNVSFSLDRGKSLGIVGENGSGKSTLLQLISGVLTPTSGSVEYHGSVLGLLELGIGFHVEFTGRQNIFLYGDVLGLPRSLIKSRLDEIIAFAELGEFIDHSLRTYSTGMRMRLAFSLVASLDPDILIVDEALTVGDNYFQKKCLDHITKIKEAGRTIIFCSHSIYQIGMFCEETLWLKQGAVQKHGDTPQVLAAYEAYQLRKSEQANQEGQAGHVNVPVRITSVKILNELPISRGEDLKLQIHTEAVSDDLPFHIMVSLKYGADFGVYVTGTHLSGKPPIRGRQRQITVTYPKISLLGGYYWFHIRTFDDQGMIIYHEKILIDPELEVIRESKERGFCYLDNDWEIK
jgi:lipopolysaccharide transport system ATP-binding protein